jgi:hypothetical protein
MNQSLTVMKSRDERDLSRSWQRLRAQTGTEIETDEPLAIGFSSTILSTTKKFDTATKLLSLHTNKE